MAFESVVELENWRSALIVSLTEVKERGQNAAIIEVLAC